MRKYIVTNMPQQITINKEWLERLVQIVEQIRQEDDEVLKHSWFSYLLGYVNSLDIYLKEK